MFFSNSVKVIVQNYLNTSLINFLYKSFHPQTQLPKSVAKKKILVEYRAAEKHFSLPTDK